MIAVGGCAVLMIIAGYMGAVSVVTTVKWFWFLFGMAMFLPVVYSLARTFRETVITRKDSEIIELYGKVVPGPSRRLATLSPVVYSLALSLRETVMRREDGGGPTVMLR